MQEAWSLFRFGAPDGYDGRRSFPGQRFPTDYLETFAHQFVPRWLSTTEAQVAALGAVLRRLGPATIIAHSQGAAVASKAMTSAPDRVTTLIAVEPSGLTLPRRDCPPVYLISGDYLDCDDFWRGIACRWTELASANSALTLVSLAQEFPGASHMLMMDRGSDDMIERIRSYLDARPV